MSYPIKGKEPASDDVESTESLTSNTGRMVTETATKSTAFDAGFKKRSLTIDETKLPPEEAERILLKRACNRKCAERARKRGKDNVRELHRQIEELQQDKNELRRSLVTMEKEVETVSMKKATSLQLDQMIPSRFQMTTFGGGFKSETIAALNQVRHQQRSAMLPSLLQRGIHEQAIPSTFQSVDYNSLLLLQQQLRK